MDRCESRLIELSQCDVQLSFVNIEMDGKPFRVRKYAIGAESEGKPTLVMVHGYAATGTYFFHLWKALSEHYRIVSFDNFGWGQNTRLQDSAGVDSP